MTDRSMKHLLKLVTNKFVQFHFSCCFLDEFGNDREIVKEAVRECLSQGNSGHKNAFGYSPKEHHVRVVTVIKLLILILLDSMKETVPR